MRARNRRRVDVSKHPIALVTIAALVVVSLWGWRTLPEYVRYRRMARM
jgi:hypothetical protein